MICCPIWSWHQSPFLFSHWWTCLVISFRLFSLWNVSRLLHASWNCAFSFSPFFLEFYFGYVFVSMLVVFLLFFFLFLCCFDALFVLCFWFCWVGVACFANLTNFLMFCGSLLILFWVANSHTAMFIHFKQRLNLLQVSCNCFGELHCGHVAFGWLSSLYVLSAITFAVYCLYSSPCTSSWVCLYIRFINWFAIIPLSLYFPRSILFCSFHLAQFALSFARYSVIIPLSRSSTFPGPYQGVESFCWFTPHLDNFGVTFVQPMDFHEGFLDLAYPLCTSGFCKYTYTLPVGWSTLFLELAWLPFSDAQNTCYRRIPMNHTLVVVFNVVWHIAWA